MPRTLAQPEELKSTATQTMKAVRIHDFGGLDQLRYEDAPRPQAGAGEVLVRVHAAAVNPVDWKVREGHLKSRGYQLPLILGWDLSGVVEALGEGVTAWKKGDEVFSRPDTARNGAYAEYIAVKETELARKPKELDHVHASAIPLAGLTAWQALFDAGGLEAGQKILIHAASGGVGSFAVQLAKWKGARVIGTASAENRKFVLDLGADVFIDYRKEPFEEAVHGVDMVLDTIGGETQQRSWSVLKKGGILVSLLGIQNPEEAKARGLRQASLWAQTRADQLAQLAQLADAGRLKAPVATILPLWEARRAQEISQSGHARGKIVLKVI